MVRAVLSATLCTVIFVWSFVLSAFLQRLFPCVSDIRSAFLRQRRSTDSDSVTLRMADNMANIWNVWRSVFSVFVRPASFVQLYAEKNIRVLSLSRPRLHSSVLTAISGLDMLQRAELWKVCDELTAPELLFSVSELGPLMQPLAELSQLQLTTAAAPLARQQQPAAAGPAAIVVSMFRALPDSLGGFLTALAGAGAEETPGVPPQATEIPATVPPGAVLIPGVPLAEEPPVTGPPTRSPSVATTPPPPPQEVTAATEDDSDEHGDPFLTEQDGDFLEDILSGRG